MAENTKIEWADHTWNPWEGCQKVGPGCDHCYAENRNARFAGGQAINWGPGAPRRRTSVSNWNLPLRWNAQAEAFQAQHGRRQRVFCASLADVFDNAVSREWRDDLAALILDTADLDWLLLTKRIGNAGAMLGEMFLDGPPANVWLGATVVNQAEADRDILKLLRIPASVRFLSMEPLLGPVSFEGLFANPSNIADGTNALEELDWVIVGGESGPGARPMHPDWALSLRDQCEAVGTAFMFKQWGEWRPISQMSEGEDRALWRSRVIAKPHEDQSNLDDIYGRVCTTESTVIHLDGSVHHFLEPNAFPLGAMTMYRVGKKAAGRLLNGRTWDGFPAP
ncbi:phage Gp37/Gp68 family protein [Delftia tsuruhatensis]|uniref:Phage Gp37/Gp68 family protein n=1 Tax=Delftia tsuruhatensis TaxID=180282 RepID=A0AAX3SH65_9BURK|nr:phage Gp37/Gp68 family protein [Delftia tsuruhatensis]WFF79343.1 phage Gp37/Gp68 family protein [Delftia tsuruhatensis]